MTPSGIEPATFRFVAQHLNHCATTVPDVLVGNRKFFSKETRYGLHACNKYYVLFWVLFPYKFLFLIYYILVYQVRCLTFSNIHLYSQNCRSQWPPVLRRRSEAARLLRLWVRIPSAGMDFCLLRVLRFVR